MTRDREGKWQSTPVFQPGKSHGQRSLEGYSPWGHRKSDTTQRLKKKERERTRGWRWPPLSDKPVHPSCLLPLGSKEDLEEEQSSTAMMVHQYSISSVQFSRSVVSDSFQPHVSLELTSEGGPGSRLVGLSP